MIPCPVCAKPFTPKVRSTKDGLGKRIQRTCSTQCHISRRDYRGDKNPKWRGGPKPRIKAQPLPKPPKPPKVKAIRVKKPKRLCCECKVLPIKAKKSLYCVECGPKGTKRAGGAPRICAVCNGPFRSSRDTKVTCGDECSRKRKSLRQLGDKSHRWQGGKTSEAMVVRNSLTYANWRKAVFARDDYTCQSCGQRGGKLDADHIKPFSQYPELRFELTNGRTLCRPCHTKTDTWGYRSRRTREDVIESIGGRL